MKKTIITFALLLAFGQAFAQQSQNERKGLLIGISAGVGVVSISGDAAGISEEAGISLPNLKVGWFLNPKLAAMVTLPGIPYEQNGNDRSFDGFIPSVQYFAQPNWWVSGGLGLGLDTPAFYEDGGDKNYGVGVQISTGYEFYRKGRFAFDVQGTFFGANVETDTGNRKAASILTGIGVSFY